MALAPKYTNANAMLSHFSRVRLLATPWTAAYQAPLSMDFPVKSTGVGAIAFSEYSVLVVPNNIPFFPPTVIVGSSTQYLVIGRNHKQYLKIGWHSCDTNSSVVKNDYSKANKKSCVCTLFLFSTLCF